MAHARCCWPSTTAIGRERRSTCTRSIGTAVPWGTLKAHHAMDLPFVFDNTEVADATAASGRP